MKPTEPVTPRTEAGKALLTYYTAAAEDAGRPVPKHLVTAILAIENQARALAEDEMLGDVAALASALQIHQHGKDVVGYCYKGHGEDTKNEAQDILRAWRQNREGNGG